MCVSNTTIPFWSLNRSRPCPCYPISLLFASRYVQDIQAHAYAPGAIRNLHSQWKRYLHFFHCFSLTPLPASISTVSCFLTYLSRKTTLYQYMINHLNSIWLLHLHHGSAYNLLNSCVPQGPILQPITFSHFSNFLKETIMAIGWDATNFSPHSFWQGSATHAYQSTVPDHFIKLHGDCCSDAYKLLYLSLPLATRTLIADIMAASLFNTV